MIFKKRTKSKLNSLIKKLIYKITELYYKLLNTKN